MQAVDGGKNALYSILKEAMIYDADGDSQLADLLEDIGFEFEQSCVDNKDDTSQPSSGLAPWPKTSSSGLLCLWWCGTV